MVIYYFVFYYNHPYYLYILYHQDVGQPLVGIIFNFFIFFFIFFISFYFLLIFITLFFVFLNLFKLFNWFKIWIIPKRMSSLYSHFLQKLMIWCFWFNKLIWIISLSITCFLIFLQLEIKKCLWCCIGVYIQVINIYFLILVIII